MGGAWLGWIVICGLAAAQDETTPDKKQDPKPPGKEVIVIGDPRITTKNYGGVFLKSFEPMPSTSSVDDVAQFLAAHESEGAVA